MTIFIAFISISYSASDIIASFFNFLQNALINPSSSRISLTMFSKDVIFPIKGLHREFPPHHFQDPKGNSSTFNTNLLPKNKKKIPENRKRKSLQNTKFIVVQQTLFLYLQAIPKKNFYHNNHTRRTHKHKLT